VSVAQVLSRAQLGLEAPLVQIEAHLGSGLPGFSIVGLPAPVVRESRERVRSAILNAGYDFPPGRITVNLAPVELSKEGGRYDLPVALALLIASGQLDPTPRAPTECYGELGPGGELRPSEGCCWRRSGPRRPGTICWCRLPIWPRFAWRATRAHSALRFCPKPAPSLLVRLAVQRKYPNPARTLYQWRNKTAPLTR
jgi:hypothetical protein